MCIDLGNGIDQAMGPRVGEEREDVALIATTCVSVINLTLGPATSMRHENRKLG